MRQLCRGLSEVAARFLYFITERPSVVNQTQAVNFSCPHRHTSELKLREKIEGGLRLQGVRSGALQRFHKGTTLE